MRKRSFKEKYGSAYENLSEKDNKYLVYPLFFYYRRVLLPLIILFFNNYLITHYFTMTMSGVATIILIGW